MHIHTLTWVKRTTYLNCDGCSLRVRLATYAEACYVREFDDFRPDAPMEFDNRVIVVPLDYSVPSWYVKEKN